MYNSLLPTSLLLLLTQNVLSTPAASTITVSSPPAPTSTTYTSDTTFRNSILDAHNFYRDEHNASALTWNTTSAAYALDWASKCQFQHTGGPTGENLAAGYANATAAVDGWGGERVDYKFGKNPTGFSEKTGHFTQVVWRNTTSVGCGRFACNGKNKTPGYYVVCEYYPPGNVNGADDQYFIDNVKEQVKGKESDTVETGVTNGACSTIATPEGALFWLLRLPLIWLVYNITRSIC